MSLIKEKIHSLVQKFEQNKGFYSTARFNETMLRSEFLDPFFEILGWDIKNNAAKSTNEREVLLEEPLKANAESHSKKPDYTFRLYGERKFFVEAKKPCVHIDQEDEPAKQVRRYGYTAGLKISVLSNFEYLLIYETTQAVNSNDLRTKGLVKSYHYSEYEDKADEILSELGKDAVYSGSFDEKWAVVERNIIPISIDQMFLEQINSWRIMLGREILRVSPNIEIVELGDIVQSYINKILFLRVCEDRNIETYQRLLQIANHNSGQELISKFREADTKYNSGLFEERLSSEVICNIESIFWTIIRQLYYPESPYSFAVLSSDILGKIYEIFLSQRLALIDGELCIVNKPENEEKDIVTTPNYIVREIIRRALKDDINDLTDEQIFELKFADIACGSGVFLMELYQSLYDSLLDYYIKHDTTKLIQTSISTYRLRYDIKKRLLTNCIYGVDKDFNAVEASKFGLLLKLLEGEDETTLSSYHPILPSLDENIFFGNSLISPDERNEAVSGDINPFDFGELRFDYIVGNPPYMKTEDIKNITPLEHKLYPSYYASAYKQYDKYFLFIERALKLLKEGGTLGYIVPSKFMKVGAASPLRKIITREKKVSDILSFGAHQVFSDRSTYTCIIILHNKENEAFEYSEVESISSWQARIPESISKCSRSADCINDETWVLYTDKFKDLYDKILNHSEPLHSIVGDDYIFNGIQTSANKVYVFTPTSEDRKYYYFKGYNKHDYKIEKAVTKAYYKTVQGKDSFYSYQTFNPNARVIFPYKRDRRGKTTLLSLAAIEKNYPSFYSYLLEMKDILNDPKRDIKPVPTNENEWHRYGRQQSLDACEVSEKLIVGVLSQSDKYAVDKHGTLISSGGTAGYCMISVPNESEYSIYYIQAILGSTQGEWLASLYGEIFRGGYIARGTKVLRQIPIRTIDFNDDDERGLHDDIVERQKRLISLGDKLAKAKNNPRARTPIQRQFDILKARQQDAINALYGMTKEDELRIPKIKELYAAN